MNASSRFSIIAPLLAAIALPGFALAATRQAPQNFIRESASAGTLQDGKVVFSGKRVTIPVVAVAPGAPDTTFEIHGKINPTLIVPAGTELRFELANNDAGMDHTLDVTTNAPPYALVPKNIPITAPQNPSTVPGLLAATGKVPARQGHSSRLAMHATASFRLEPGTYYYVCAMPGHAQRGMYGKLVARESHRR